MLLGLTSTGCNGYRKPPYNLEKVMTPIDSRPTGSGEDFKSIIFMGEIINGCRILLADLLSSKCDQYRIFTGKTMQWRA
jgi:hypothetical protein